MSEEQKNNKARKFERIKFCPICGEPMKYMFGEVYKCQKCGRSELTDFGKVREFLEKSGPQPAVVISRETGVALDVIDKFLKEGRVEIPDGSDIYIKCQSCGTDIRYGRFCPECMLRMSKDIGQAMLSPEVGERPRSKSGKMHTLEENDRFNRFSRDKSKKNNTYRSERK